MRQTRLENYFPSQNPFIPSGRSFLDLPSSVRKLVYEYVGIDSRFVDLNYTNLKVYPNGAYPETRDCRKLSTEGWYDLKKVDVAEQDEVWEIENELGEDIDCYGESAWIVPYGSHQGLLLVSKQIHQEVETFTYATAVFRVCLGQPLGFTRLLRMSDNALSHLSSLTIRLDVPRNAVSDDGWINTNNHGWENRTLTPFKHLNLSSRWGKNIMKIWTSFLERLAQLIRPGQLQLYVLFGVMEIADAKVIIKPMTQLPQLKDCGICVEKYGEKSWWRLDPPTHNGYSYRKHWDNNLDPPMGTEEDAEVSQFIRLVAQKLTTVQSRFNAPFRYLDLPQEIRFAILEYTDLVSPREVQWRPRERIVGRRTCIYCNVNGCRMTTDEGDVLCECDRLVSLKSIENYDFYPCCKSCGPKDYSGICYCYSHSSIWSLSCKCNFKRSALFAVSSQVRQDAIPVYYAHNDILITPHHSPLLRRMGDREPWPKSYNPPTQLKAELSLYLSSIVCNALQYIRRLEWILPNPGPEYLRPRTKAWFDYLDTILLMEHAMTLTALTFIINISSSRIKEYSWRWFEAIVLPMRRLGEAGLKDLFVYLPPIKDTSRREHHERDLERAIMGKEYNSAARGKPVERMQRLLRRDYPEY